jgi:hypothetical protein
LLTWNVIKVEKYTDAENRLELNSVNQVHIYAGDDIPQESVNIILLIAIKEFRNVSKLNYWKQRNVSKIHDE